MNGLILASLKNPYAVTVGALTIIVIGILSALALPIDILPVFNSPAVQVLTFYGGMPADSVEKDITSRMERWTGQANGMQRQESRSIVGASIIRNYFRGDVDPNGALTQVNSLASAAIPNLPPGTLPPVILPFDPTSTTPSCIVALDSKTENESTLYDVGRYEVRNMIMANPGAVAPVVYGGKIRAVMVYLDRKKLEARQMSPLDVMNALDNSNLFLPTGDAKLGRTDYALDSNSMYDLVDRMGDIPLRSESGNAAFIRDVGTPRDSAFIQTNIVRVNGRKQVYIPVFRQLGASTLKVVDMLRESIKTMVAKLSRPGIDLKVVMDQSVFVHQSIASLIQEGVLGAVLCSLVILLFLGEWRMTVIAVTTLPIAVLSALIGLYATGNTINVMTLAGLSLAIGPMVDSAIICLENTHRHLGLGATPKEAAFLGASEVAVPELVAALCTLLVLAPLAFMPGLGAFLFKPMATAVGFAMASAYVLSRTVVPAACYLWLKPHAAHEVAATHAAAASHHDQAETFRLDKEARPRANLLARAFARWERMIEATIRWYVQRLETVLNHRVLIVGLAVGLLAAVIGLLGTQLRREFFPDVDSGAFEMVARAASGTRIEVTNDKIAQLEDFIRDKIPKHDLDLIISELGVTSDWSAAYTPNAGPMDAVVKIQLEAERKKSAQSYVEVLRTALAKDKRFNDLEFAFDAGGMIRGAMNEGKSTPLNVRVTGKNMEQARRIAESIREQVVKVQGVVDVRIIQRLDYPEYVIDVDRTKAADLGLNQMDVMKNVVAAFNSSIQFNKKNFWIDPVTHNQYFVGVQFPEGEITSTESLLNIPINSPTRKTTVPLRNVVALHEKKVPTEVTHNNLQPSIDLTMGVSVRDLGHVADDVHAVVARFGKANPDGSWTPFDPAGGKQLVKGAKITLTGEYSRMQDTFRSLGIGLILASLLIYFLMVALFKSYVTPLVILSAVPIGLVGVVTILYVTGTAINVQSLLGVIFMVGIVVSNTVLLVDFAQNLRGQEGLSPTAAIKKAASIRVRPVVMTALAAFFALIPMALALEKGSEANGPLGRAVIGGLVAGLLTTLFVVPSLYSLAVRDKKVGSDRPDDGAASAGTIEPGTIS